MIEFAQALDLIITHASPVLTETILLENALGRILAKPVNSIADIPPFNNTAMDGYAVNARDLKNASKQNPVRLGVLGISAAGEYRETSIDTQGKAWKIMTGAPVPAGFDSIIPVENTSSTDNSVTCFSSPEFGEHIRTTGEDFKKDQTIIKANVRINANHIMAMCAQGISQIIVYRKLTVAVFTTGKELVDDPQQKLEPGQIRNSNKIFGISWLQNFPVKVHDAGTNLDDPEKFERDLAVQLKQQTQIIISSGAVSMGDFDFIPTVIQKLGGEIIFHKNKIKPGKPILFAKFNNGSYFFGLPGNPISAAIGLRFFVSTLIFRLLGQAKEKPHFAQLNNDHSKKIGFRHFLKAHAHINENAQLTVNLLDGQESFKIQPLLQANGWAVFDENLTDTKRGSIIPFYSSEPHWK